MGHGCDMNSEQGGICIKGEGNNDWKCGCKAGYMCTAGCKEKRIGHKCESREILSKRKARAHKHAELELKKATRHKKAENAAEKDNKTKEKERKEKAAAIESKE